jgi:hypothetical protein
MKGLAGAALAALLIVFAGSDGAAQLPPEPQAAPPRRGGMPPVPPDGALLPGEVDRILEAYVITEAQRVLQIGNEQYPEFFRRMQHLQNLQRMHRNQRQRAIVELRQMIRPNFPPAEDAVLMTKIRELDDIDAQFQMRERQALIAVDVILQPLQRAHFRVFLQQVEIRKSELLRAAQGGAGRPGRVGQQPGRAVPSPIR